MAFYKIVDNCQISIGFIYEQFFGCINNGNYVEVGAFDGINYSNTVGLAMAGWRGICIEPNPNSYKILKDNYSNLKTVTLYNVAIGNDDKCIINNTGAISTTSPESFEIFKNAGWVQGNFSGIEIPMRKLDDILLENNYPKGFEVLCIDTEGTELEVLKSFDLNFWQPKMVIVEAQELHTTPGFNRHSKEINNIFTTDYTKIYSDTINNIYVRNNG